MPLPHLSHNPILRGPLDPSDPWELFYYPFNTLPPLECHLSPPLVVINGGSKLVDLDLDAVSLTYHMQETSEAQRATKERLTVLNRIWSLITGAKELANT